MGKKFSPETEHEIVRAHEVDRRSIDELAQQFNCSAGTIKNTLRRVRPPGAPRCKSGRRPKPREAE